MSEITKDFVHSLIDLDATRQMVENKIAIALTSAAGTISFASRYANLNSWFGSGVASLAGKIGRSRAIFVDKNEPIVDAADRSVYVASYFFDAARDEFDDRDTDYRDTHRCLAQAFLKGIVAFYFDRFDGTTDTTKYAEVNALLAQPLWLQGLGDRVATGYAVFAPDTAPTLFRAMGYHLGSEILADQEFSLLDGFMRQYTPELTTYLQNNSFSVAGQLHPAYAWVGLHSGDGGAKEVDHFTWATQGINTALQYTPNHHHTDFLHQVKLGIHSFVHDHAEFFRAVGT